MNTIDLTPLYRNSVGFDGFGRLLNSALRQSDSSTGYPPYNIEVLDENQYAITLALAGFSESELNIEVENSVLKVSGRKPETSEPRQFLHQGIAHRNFERKFTLAEHVEVVAADFEQGLLNIRLEKRIPEALKPRSIAINGQKAISQEQAA